jgi:hypothetical protein
MLDQGVVTSSLAKLSRRQSARPDKARQTMDAARGSHILANISGVPGETENERPFSPLMSGAFVSTPLAPRHGAAERGVGTLLYLISVALVAAATVGVFFGVGFSLLLRPAGGEASSTGSRYPVTELKSLAYNLPSPSDRYQLPTDGKLGAVPPKTSVPALGGGTASSRIPLPPPVVDEAQPPEKNEALHASTSPSTAIEGNRGPAENPSAPREVQAGPSMAKAASNAPGQSAAAPDPASSSLTAAPTQGPPNLRLSAADITELLRQGDALLKKGDVASARLFYERIAAAGDGRGALRLGASFDPAFLSRAGLRNLRGDAAEARSWYGRALDLGTAEAKRQLDSLETKQGP